MDILNWRNCSQENLVRNTEGKPPDINLISSNNITKIALRTNSIKVKIGNAQQISSVGHVESDKTVYSMINKRKQTSTKRIQNMNDWVGKGIPRELCTRLKLSHAIKWFISK